ncbi:MAG: hypothetical protein LBS33_06830 [Streptococcaceae bacterium]|nr:hypothetical protein [Streptococcaceae bacterium]
MRIQMRMSYEARVIIEEEKLNYLKRNVKVTSGEVVDNICERYASNYQRIDWVSVRNNPEYEGVLAHYTEVSPSALTLNQNTIDLLDKLIVLFNLSFGMKRTVYRSFVVRMVLKAFVLDKNNHNIWI